MASTIKLKNGSGAPTSGQLVQGEPALDLTNKRLYTENASGTVIEVGTNPAAEITANAGIALPDNQKATFGADDDLQIYSDGTNSIIKEATGGSLYIGGADTHLMNPTFTEYYISAVENGAVSLRYDGAAKLATTATGIDVIGTVTADGLTVDGSATISGAATAGFVTPLLAKNPSTNAASAVKIGFDAGGTTWGEIGSAYNSNDPYMAFFVRSGSEKLRITDAGRVGIGTASPNATLALDKNTATQHRVLDLENNSITYSMYIDQDNTSTNSWSLFDTTNSQTALRYLPSSSGYWQFYTNDTERLRIDANGKIFMNEGVPFAWTDGSLNVSADIYGDSSDNLVFRNTSAKTERMRIDSSGNLLVGRTSTSGLGKLNVEGGADFTGGNVYLCRDSGDLLVGTTSANGKLTVNSGTGALISSFTSTDTNGGYIYFGSTGGGAGYIGSSYHLISGIPTDDYFAIRAENGLDFAVGGTRHMRIDSTGNVGIGQQNPNSRLQVQGSGTTPIVYISNGIDNAPNRQLAIKETSGSGLVYDIDSTGASGALGQLTLSTNGAERMRIDASGNLLVGTTSETTWTTTAGFRTRPSGSTTITRSAAPVLYANRLTSDGAIQEFLKDGSTVGSIGVISSGNLYIGNNLSAGLRFTGSAVYAATAGTGADNTYNFGASSVRWATIYAATGTINTSDRNDKTEIVDISEAELRVAQACKGLMKRFKFKDAVETKGDNARYHFGVIAQDLKAAFEAEGLNAEQYACFCSDTWTDEETGEERTRLGVRYEELLAFIIAAI